MAEKKLCRYVGEDGVACTKVVFVDGYCSKHYQLVHGHPYKPGVYGRSAKAATSGSRKITCRVAGCDKWGSYSTGRMCKEHHVRSLQGETFTERVGPKTIMIPDETYSDPEPPTERFYAPPVPPPPQEPVSDGPAATLSALVSVNPQSMSFHLAKVKATDKMIRELLHTIADLAVTREKFLSEANTTTPKP